MEDQKNTDENKTSRLTINISGKLQLSKPDAAQIKQSIAHGRSKTVTVEVKKNRSIKDKISEPNVETPSKVEEETSLHHETESNTLTAHEKSVRIHALKQADKKYVYKSLLKVNESKPLNINENQDENIDKISDNSSDDVKEQPEFVGQEKNKDEKEIISTTDNSKVEKELKNESNLNVSPSSVESEKPNKSLVSEVDEDDDEYTGRKKSHSSLKQFSANKKIAKLDTTKKRGDERRLYNKISVNTLGDDDEPVRSRSVASMRRAREKAKRYELKAIKDNEKIIREVILPEVITVQELANRMAEKGTEVIKQLMKLGVMATINQIVDADTAELIIHELGHKVKRVTEADVENILVEEQDSAESQLPRAPIVTIMGHVDHGKTTLLDALRSTDVASGEAGGITQHIGAYRVELANGQAITFLDTPGHEAFTAMRARGAKITDIIVLVVAANDGIMAQTAEAISHAKAANLPIIVAINKIDLPDADPQNIRNTLLNYELVSEELGGDIMVVEVSAKNKKNIDKLEEAILLQAELLDLRANPNRVATGTVIEAKIDKGRGVVATFLVQKGTLKVGDIVVGGISFGKVRAMHNDKGQQVFKATPSVAVEVIGLNDTPEAGDLFSVIPTERQAREISVYRSKRLREMRTARIQKNSLEELFSTNVSINQLKELSIIVRADVQGSVEAIVSNLIKLSSEEVTIRILHAAVGGITESDVVLAKASKGVILGFNVRANNQARNLADQEGIELHYYFVIYDLIDEIRSLIGGMLSPIVREQILGTIEVRQVFSVGKVGKIAGCFVTKGIIKRNCKIRLLRDNIVIHTGKIKGLRRFKEDVKEVREGFECGIMLESYDDIREKDSIEAFEMIEEKQNF